MKKGYVYQILEQDNVVIIRETETMIDYILFIDSISRTKFKQLYRGREVLFSRETSAEQFVINAIKIGEHGRLRVVA